eukprot:3650186-Rhodomonas_salina.2
MTLPASKNRQPIGSPAFHRVAWAMSTAKQLETQAHGPALLAHARPARRGAPQALAGEQRNKERNPPARCGTALVESTAAALDAPPRPAHSSHLVDLAS